MSVYGTRMFGKVDAVPGLGHVATRFFHINFLPLIPTATYLIMSQSGNSFRGVKIPLSLKSWVMAWVRTLSVLAGVVGGIFLLISIVGNSSDREMLVPGLVLSMFGWGVFTFSKTHRSATRASYRRACELGRLVNLSPAGMSALAAAYGEAPLTHGFEPIPLPAQTAVPPAVPRALPVQSLPVEPVSADGSPAAPLPMLEVIDVDGEDGDAEPGELAAEQAEAPAVAAAVTPMKGY